MERRTVIMKSAAVPGVAHFAGIGILIGVESLLPNAGSADKVWMIYVNARQRPCCSRQHSEHESDATTDFSETYEVCL